MSKAHHIRPLPSVEFLRECLDYDPDTGVLIWKIRPREHFVSYKGWAVWNGKNALARAGNVRATGHRRVIINKMSYQEHRVIFKLMTGADPPETIDHVDGDPAGNRWHNLRPASHLEQKWNMKVRADNKSGYRGVHPVPGSATRWAARISVNGRYRHLGCFASKVEASAAYENAARQSHGKFYRKV